MPLRLLCSSFTLFVTPLVMGNAVVDSFLSSSDVIRAAPGSHLNLQNNSGELKTVYGLYVHRLSYVMPGQSCDSAISLYSGVDNRNAGAFLAPVQIAKANKAQVGSNYLYNMLYDAIYYYRVITPVSPAGCSLPGCTWGDDTSQVDWCIYLGALAPNNNSETYSSVVPPFADPVATADYNFNLVTDYHYLGPIHCDDEQMSCSAATTQIQSFS